MIVSASRRTDLPAQYPEWLFNRLREEVVYVRNPMNFHQIGKINLSPEVVDGIVFWTKNPTPMLGRLNEIKKYNYYFQITLTAYGRDVEPNLPSKNEVLIPSFQKLGEQIGKDRVIWRYDPIFLNKTYTMDYHIHYFEVLCKKLAPYTEKCTVSFLDLYKNTERNVKPLNLSLPTIEQQNELMKQMSAIANKYGIYIDTCAESGNFDQFGVKHACCIDKARFEKLCKCRLIIGKDKNQRSECGCIESIDIGTYNTCANGCLYCYANYNKTNVNNNKNRHNPNSPLLFGEIGPDDVIKERKVKSNKDTQMSLIDFI